MICWQWDTVAESVAWARSRSSVFVDTHWVGGDPAKGEVYGWAAWRQAASMMGTRVSDGFRGDGDTCRDDETQDLQAMASQQQHRHTCTLTLRNPSDHASSILLEAGEVFELPAHARNSSSSSHSSGSDTANRTPHGAETTTTTTTQPSAYTFTSPYDDQRVRSLRLVVGRPKRVRLGPYEVLSFQGWAK